MSLNRPSVYALSAACPNYMRCSPSEAGLCQRLVSEACKRRSAARPAPAAIAWEATETQLEPSVGALRTARCCGCLDDLLASLGGIDAADPDEGASSVGTAVLEHHQRASAALEPRHLAAASRSGRLASSICKVTNEFSAARKRPF